MKIDIYFDEFIRSIRYDKDLQKAAKRLLKENKESGLPSMPGFDESEYLGSNIRESVKSLTRGKDTAIAVYRRLVTFLQNKGVPVSVEFPPVPVDNSFERQMFIAKYLQDEDTRISDLEDLLWVSERTISDDLLRLSGDKDPIQVCGRPFIIREANRSRGRMHFGSTAHPLFLTENLTQVIVILKGLRAMAENPLYIRYAEASAADIWQQLSDYARKRIRFVLSDLMPEDLSWYEELEKRSDLFMTERECSVNGNVWLDCIKNDKPFYVEYHADDGVVFYEDCRFVPGSISQGENGFGIEVECKQGRKKLVGERVIRSTYSIEELLSD